MILVVSIMWSSHKFEWPVKSSPCTDFLGLQYRYAKAVKDVNTSGLNILRTLKHSFGHDKIGVPVKSIIHSQSLSTGTNAYDL